MSGRRLAFNGLDASTGLYVRPAMTADELAEVIRARIEPRDPLELEAEILGTPEDLSGHAAARRRRGEPPPWVNGEDIASSGWGVIFPQAADHGERAALEELLIHRRAQVSQSLFREYVYRPGDNLETWLARHGIGPGTPEPERMPYYLLIVGGPEQIPFDFQLDLAQQAAVGRLCFDTSEEYARYAQGVIAAEQKPPLRVRRAAIFAVRNQDDLATDAASRRLVGPLLEILERHAPAWRLEKVLAEQATKERLRQLLAHPEPPAFLFTSSHGVAPNLAEPEPPGLMGALVCQDWPGALKWHEPLVPDFLFTAEDIPDEADVSGLISFHFACFSLGTPRLDSFAHESAGEPAELALTPSIARLPQRLLGREGGGALAVIGHVDRARGFSYVWPRAGSQPQAFASVIWRLLDGQPVGLAIRHLADRYAAVALRLNAELLSARRGEHVDARWLCHLWTASIDSRSYAVLGDPAARLRLAD